MAKKDADALARVFEDKGKLKQNPKQAAKDAGGSDEFAEWLGGLDDTEIMTLGKAHDELSRLDVKGKSESGATVTFL